jgi:hypothetical protein
VELLDFPMKHHLAPDVSDVAERAYELAAQLHDLQERFEEQPAPPPPRIPRTPVHLPDE